MDTYQKSLLTAQSRSHVQEESRPVPIDTWNRKVEDVERVINVYSFLDPRPALLGTLDEVEVDGASLRADGTEPVQIAAPEESSESVAPWNVPLLFVVLRAGDEPGQVITHAVVVVEWCIRRVRQWADTPECAVHWELEEMHPGWDAGILPDEAANLLWQERE